jgi:hypothetical protein
MSVSLSIWSLSVFSSANLTASLTSSKSLANFVIANYFSSSIILRYLLTVSSFSRTYFVYSMRNAVISPSPFFSTAFNSSVFFFNASISVSCSANSALIFFTSSLLSSASPSLDEPDSDFFVSVVYTV